MTSAKMNNIIVIILFCNQITRDGCNNTCRVSLNTKSKLFTFELLTVCDKDEDDVNKISHYLLI